MLNPYLKLSIPREGGLKTLVGSTVLGVLLHWKPRVEARRKLKAHFQLKVLERLTGTQVSVIKNVAYSWDNLTFAAYQDYSLTEGKSEDARFSLSGSASPFRFFVEADFVNMSRFTGLTAGLSFSPTASLKLSWLWNRYFEHANSAAAYALDFIPSGRSSLRLLHYSNGKTAARVDYHLTPHVSLALLASVHKLTPEAALLIKVDL